MSETGSNQDRHRALVSRRQALKTGVFVAGSAMWVTPLIQAVTVAQASADQPSGGKDKVKVKVDK